MSQSTFRRHSRFVLVARRAVLFGVFALLVGAASFAGFGTASAESAPDFRIIVHSDNPNGLNRDFLTDAYLKRVTRWPDGEVVYPVDQRAGSGVRQKFSDTILKRSVAAVKRYWQQRIFSGRELPPPELESDEAVIGYVASHRGALGYVSGSAKVDRAKVVTVR